MQKKTSPGFVPPMMAQSAKEPFDSRDWIFEIKLDGYRAITVFDADGKPRLWSRNGLPLEQKFPAISKAVSRLKTAFYRRQRKPEAFRRVVIGRLPQRKATLFWSVPSVVSQLRYRFGLGQNRHITLSLKRNRFIHGAADSPRLL